LDAGLNLSVNVPASATCETGPLTTGTVKDGWRELPLTAGTPTTFRILVK
jgi:hypothetical protein